MKYYQTFDLVKAELNNCQHGPVTRIIISESSKRCQHGHTSSVNTDTRIFRIQAVNMDNWQQGQLAPLTAKWSTLEHLILTRRYMQDKIFFLGNFRAIFRDGQRSVAEPGPTPSPWSIHHVNTNFVSRSGRKVGIPKEYMYGQLVSEC